MSRGELGKFCIDIVGRNLMPVTVGTEKVLVVLLKDKGFQCLLKVLMEVYLLV